MSVPPGTTLGGRYRVESELSRGGMGFLVVAEDLRLGRKVAVKFFDLDRIGTGLQASVQRARFTREGRVLASLEHPNVVGVHDVGEHTSAPVGADPATRSLPRLIPYLILDLIEGATLREPIRAGEPPDLLPALDVAIAICRACAYVNERGILHRDIKPENIMLDPTGRPVLVDFGLADVEEDTALTTPGHVPGTVVYLAPERLQGEPASVRSEIFSAGVTFYEYLTGRYPFSRESFFYSLAYEDPPSPTSVRPDLPRTVEAVLLRMLAKRAQDRYGGFAEVAADLERCAQREREPALAIDQDDGFLAWQASAVHTRLSLPFVGRSGEIARLEAGLARASAGMGQAVAVRGEAGLGKSRLVEEVLQRASLRRMPGWRGQAEGSQGAPYQLFSSLLGAWATRQAISGGPGLATHLSGRGTELSDASDVLAGLLGWVPLKPSERRQISEAVLAWLADLASEHAIVVVLEDLHAADPASLELLRAIVPGVAGLRILLLLTYRDSEGQAADVLADIDDIERLSLAPLAPAEVSGLMGALLVESDSQLGDRIARETLGIPVLVAELLRDLRQRGVLVPRGAGFTIAEPIGDDALVDGIDGLVRRRLERLSPRLREVAEIAAVFGEAVQLEPLMELAGQERAVTLRQVRELERHHLLLVPDGPGYRFSHALVRDVLYGDIAQPMRIEYHRLYADWLVPRAKDPDAGRLARQLDCAERAVEAAPWHRRAGDYARSNFAYEAAVDHYRAALAAEPDIEADRLLEAVGDLLMELGRLEEAETSFEALGQLGEAQANREWQARSCHGRGRIASRRGDNQKALSVLARGLDWIRAEFGAEFGAEDAPGNPHCPEVAALLHLTLAFVYQSKGRLEEALASETAAVAAARRVLAPSVLPAALRELARGQKRLGRLREARVALDEATQLEGEPSTQVRIRLEQGSLEQAEGHLQEAVRHYETAVADAERQRGPDLLATMRVNLAQALILRGEFGRATELLRATVAFASRTSHRQLHIAALVNLVSSLTESGELAEATTQLAVLDGLLAHADDLNRQGIDVERLSLALELGQPEARTAALGRTWPQPFVGVVELRLGESYLREAPSTALEHADRAIAALQSPSEAIFAGRANILRARNLIALGRRDEAVAALDRCSAAADESLWVERDRQLALGELALADADADSAIAAFQAALATAERQPSRLRAQEALLALAATLARVGRCGEANDLRRRAASLAADEVQRTHGHSSLASPSEGIVEQRIPTDHSVNHFN